MLAFCTVGLFDPWEALEESLPWWGKLQPEGSQVSHDVVRQAPASGFSSASSIMPQSGQEGNGGSPRRDTGPCGRKLGQEDQTLRASDAVLEGTLLLYDILERRYVALS